MLCLVTISVTACSHFQTQSSKECTFIDMRCELDDLPPLKNDIKTMSDELVNWHYRYMADRCHCDWIRLNPTAKKLCAKITEEIQK